MSVLTLIYTILSIVYIWVKEYDGNWVFFMLTNSSIFLSLQVIWSQLAVMELIWRRMGNLRKQFIIYVKLVCPKGRIFIVLFYFEFHDRYVIYSISLNIIAVLLSWCTLYENDRLSEHLQFLRAMIYASFLLAYSFVFYALTSWHTIFMRQLRLKTSGH